MRYTSHFSTAVDRNRRGSMIDKLLTYFVVGVTVIGVILALVTIIAT